MRAINRSFTMLVALGLSLFFLGGVGIGIFTHHVRSQSLSQQAVMQDVPIAAASPTPEPEPSLTLLLLGRGGAGHDGGALTDTILLVRFLYTQKRVVMVSLPRDLWVTIPYSSDGGVPSKLNAAYAIGIDSKNYGSKLPQFTGRLGGGELAKTMVQAVTGVRADYFITLDFNGFTKAINTIGGVEIDVQSSFSDYEYPIAGRERMVCNDPAAIASGSALTEGVKTVEEGIKEGIVQVDTLPKLSKEFPCRYELLTFIKGKQHMDGLTALKYVRSRHAIGGDGGDFARSTRQRQLIQAVASKLFSANLLTNIPNFYSSLTGNMDTDLSIASVLGLLPKANELRSYPITQLSLSDDNYLKQGYSVDRQYVLLPRAGEFEYEPITNWIRSHLDPTIPLVYPVVQIQASSSLQARSKQIQEALALEKIPASLVVARSATSSSTLTIQNAAVAPSAVQKIQSILGENGATITQASLSGVSTYDVLIRLGGSQTN